MKEHLPFADETYRILGACFEVYNELGCGFLEPVYQECLSIEFQAANIPFAAQKILNLTYKGESIDKKYVVDFVCFGNILVEIKAASRLIGEHRAQTLNYLHAGDFDVGLLVNFGHYPKLEHDRFLNRRLDTSRANASRWTSPGFVDRKRSHNTGKGGNR